MLKERLVDLGLSKKEAKIYMKLLELGSQPASVISRRIKLPRSTTQFILESLVEKHFAIRTAKNGVYNYSAESPENLKYVFESSKNKFLSQIDQKQKNLKKIIPDLISVVRGDVFQPKVLHYDGVDGIRALYEDTIKEKNAIYAFENIANMTPEVLKFLRNDYVLRRVKKKNFAYVIAPVNKANKQLRNEDKNCLRKTKLIPKKDFPVEIEVNIYGRKVAFFSYKADEMFGVIIESAAIANSMKAVFNVCWKVAK